MKITLILLILISLFLYKFVFTTTQQSVHQEQITQTEYKQAYKIKKEIESTMLALLSTLNHIHDIPSAHKAVEKLTDINNKLRQYEPKMYQLSTMDRMQIKSYVTDFIPHLKQPLHHIRDIKGAAHIIDDALKRLEETLLLYQKF